MDNILPTIVLKVSCGDEFGSCFLINDNTVITTRHCLTNHFDIGAEINVLTLNSEQKWSVEVLYENMNNDIAILKLTGEKTTTNFIPLSIALPRRKSDWTGYGFPNAKDTPHFLNGKISLINQNKSHNIYGDIELSIDPECRLSDFSGFSGSPVMVDNQIIGIIKTQMDNAQNIGAISLFSIQEIISEYINLDFNENETDATDKIINRTNFQEEFEARILKEDEQYFLVEGVPGIGKSTFCETFCAINERLRHIGTYSLSNYNSNKSTLLLANPEQLYEWLAINVSNIVGFPMPSLSQHKNSVEVANDVNALFSLLSKFCNGKNIVSTIIIDGINELFDVNPFALDQFLAVLPTKLPNNIKIIFSSTSYELVQNHINKLLSKKDTIIISGFSFDEVFEYCQNHLPIDLFNNQLVEKINKISEGHPLYLRYIVDYIQETNDISLIDFPVFSGSIETYYENIWRKISEDPQLIYILGIVARLRDEIGEDILSNLLNQEQQLLFQSLRPKILHLLYIENGNISIYHQSFTLFIENKTLEIDDSIYNQLSEYVVSNLNSNYATENLVYFLLRSNKHKSLGIQYCNQEWAEKCAKLGVNPHLILSDIQSALSTAFTINDSKADSPEVVRLLLLKNRIQYRYNNLFLNDIVLTAKAFINLGRVQEIFNHIVRYDTLIIHIGEALEIANMMFKNGSLEEAEIIFDKIFDKTLEHYKYIMSARKGIEISEIIYIHQILLKSQVGLANIFHDNRERKFEVFFKSLEQILEANECSYPEAYWSLSAAIFVERVHLGATIIELPAPEDANPDAILGTLFQTLLGMYEETIWQKLDLSRFYEEIYYWLDKSNDIDQFYNSEITPIFYKLKAPKLIIEKVVSIFGYIATKPDGNIINTNNVNVNFAELDKLYLFHALNYYINGSLEQPILSTIDKSNFINYFRNIVENIAYCDSKLRLQFEENSLSDSNLIIKKLEQISKSLLFNLSERASWEEAFFIPEQVLPVIWEYIAQLYIFYAKEECISFLSLIENNFASQLGLYNEGFRRVLDVIINLFTTQYLEDQLLNDKVFELLNLWKEFSLKGIENRKELTSDLFKQIIYYKKLDAEECANEIYDELLKHSMGPNWYKESQFSLLESAFSAIHTQNLNISKYYYEIMQSLERASGEMTFQRYVRQAKDDFIGSLSKKGLYFIVFEYFKRQTAGNIFELKQDVQKGNVDYLSPIHGMNFPGCQIVEQDAIIQIVENVQNIHWSLKWALLEVFLCGDDRYNDDFIDELAKIFNSLNREAEQKIALNRLKLIIDNEIDYSTKDKFLNQFIADFDETKKNLIKNTFNFNLDNKLVSPIDKIKASIPKTEESISQEDNDSELVLIPGQIGSSKISHIVQPKLLEIQRLLKRQNKQRAKKIALDILSAYQKYQWSIWQENISDDINYVRNILRQDATADEIISTFSSLVENESYTYPWIVAEHLISLVSNHLDEQQSIKIMDYVSEHISYILGDSNNNLRRFSFDNPKNLELESISSTNIVFLEFLTWLISHPVHLRSTKAASLLLWVLETNLEFINWFFTTLTNSKFINLGSVLTGILEIIARSNSSVIITKIIEHINPDEIFNLSQLIVLKRIVSKSKDETATQFIKSIDSRFNGKKLVLENDITKDSVYLDCLSFEINKLSKSKLWNDEIQNYILESIKLKLEDIKIEEAFELENLLCDGFSVQRKFNNRWTSYIREQINYTLLDFVSLEQAKLIEDILRPYNPNASEKKVVRSIKPLSERIIDSFKVGYMPSFIEDNGNLILNYVESCIPAEKLNNKYNPYHIEVTAVLVKRNKFSTDLLAQGLRYDLLSKDFISLPPSKEPKISIKIRPSTSYFGDYTASLQTTDFMNLTKTQNSDYSRKVWRNGRTNDINNLGRPFSEGAILSVDKSKINLFSEYEILWIVEINFELLGIFNCDNRILNI